MTGVRGHVAVGDGLPPLHFPLPMHRLVQAAATTRDYSPMHHNEAFARASGAPDAYANALLLLSMWERLVREYIGPGGTIRAIENFRMVRFTLAGSVVRVDGRVVGLKTVDGSRSIDIEVRSSVADKLTVGPGLVRAVIPPT